MRWIADAVYLVIGLLYLPIAIYNAIFLGKNRRGWAQRFGAIPNLPAHPNRIWIHAVSLGEINATPKFVEELKQSQPDVDIVFSTTTDTGFARAFQLYGNYHVFRYPLDFSAVIARALTRIKPSLIVLMELEVWFNLIHFAERRGIPVAVVNGRITERSARRLAYLGALARAMFKKLAWVGAQDEVIANRFKSLGVPSERVEVTSSMKWDTAQVLLKVDGADALPGALGLDGDQPVWVCGSTGDGEEELILLAYKEVCDNRDHQPRAAPTLVLVPRKPERFDEVARTIRSHGFRCVRRSQHPDGSTATAETGRPVILGDTMGELRKFYSLADVVFVGRSLVPMGGSDPMEVAGLGKPMIAGQHMENFESPVREFEKHNAIRIVQSSDQLAAAVQQILQDKVAAQALGARAREVVLANQGTTARTVKRVLQLLEPSPRRAG